MATIRLTDLIDPEKMTRGSEGEIRDLGHGGYEIESFTQRGIFYAVDLKTRACTCGDYVYRIHSALIEDPEAIPCKHACAAILHSLMKAHDAALSIPSVLLRFHRERSDLRREQRLGIELALIEQSQEKKARKA